MSYTIVISASAARDIERLPVDVSLRIIESIKSLAVTPRPTGCKKLKGMKEDLWRIRVGEYRIVYSVEDTLNVIDIRRVAHRSSVYR